MHGPLEEFRQVHRCRRREKCSPCPAIESHPLLIRLSRRFELPNLEQGILRLLRPAVEAYLLDARATEGRQ